MLTGIERNHEKLTELLQTPITNTEGRLSNFKKYIHLPKTLEDDLTILQKHYDAFYALEIMASHSTEDTENPELTAALNTLKAHINKQNTILKPQWLTFHAQLTAKNTERLKEIETIERKKERMESWLQLILLTSSILDLTLAITLFVAPHLSPIMAGTYLLISAVSLICQVTMLNQLITTLFSYEPLKTEQKVLSESLGILNTAFHFSEQEKRRALNQIKDTPQNASMPLSFFNMSTCFTDTKENIPSYSCNA